MCLGSIGGSSFSIMNDIEPNIEPDIGASDIEFKRWSSTLCQICQLIIYL
jgi:hypothetical protein